MGSSPVSSSSHLLTTDLGLPSPLESEIHHPGKVKGARGLPLTKSSSHLSQPKDDWDGGDVLGGHESHFPIPDPLYHRKGTQNYLRGMCMYMGNSKGTCHPCTKKATQPSCCESLVSSGRKGRKI